MQTTASDQTKKFASPNQVKESFVDWTKYDGQRVMSSVPGPLYLVLNGELRWIPDPSTYDYLFNNWDGVNIDDYLIDNAPVGLSLSSGASICKGDASPAVYLVTNQVKYLVPDPSIFNKFEFKQPTIVPQLVIDYVPTGPNVG